MTKKELIAKHAAYLLAEKKLTEAKDGLIAAIEKYHGLEFGKTRLVVDGSSVCSSAPGEYVYEGVVARFFMFSPNMRPSVMGRKVLKSGALHRKTTRIFSGDWDIKIN